MLDNPQAIILCEFKALNELTAASIMSMGGRAVAIACDVSDPMSVRRAASLTRSQLGEVDILVNNAGVMPCRRLLDLSDDEIERTMSINCTAHFWVSLPVHDDMTSILRCCT